MQARLEAGDREFFSRVAAVIFANPFSVGRAHIEPLTSAEAIARRAPDEHHFTALIPALTERCGRLERKGLGTVQAFSGEERDMIGNAYLFLVYNRFIDDLDELIRTQLRRPETAADAPFAAQAIALLKTHGFSQETALRYMALFYQLRRAYYFMVSSMVGDSPSMQQLRHALWNNVFTYDARTYEQHLWNRMEDFSTLILGETGTGKGSAAAAIGRSGYIPFDPKAGRFAHSFTDTFIAINLSQFPETLIESELFGHGKGAFTGAVDHHKGVFERCSPHGALLLDEIGEANTAIQIKLLQVLQERTFSPVGSHAQQRFGGRVIAATNRSIQELRRDGRFRDDLFYRLSSDIIIVPPLRQRIAESPTELESLVKSLVRRTTGEDSPDLVEMILGAIHRDLPPDYLWPGNVRELEQAIRRILLTRHYHGDLDVSVVDEEELLLRDFRIAELNARDLLSRYCALLYRRFGTYEEVARRAELDRRTVKKYLQNEKRD